MLTTLLALVLAVSVRTAAAHSDDAARAPLAVQAGFEAAALALEKATPAQRDAVLAELTAFGEEARARLVTALDRRLAGASTTLSAGNTLTQLDQLADARKILDLKRKRALDLIFDEERYFYPYTPPDCPPEKGKLYPAVQQQVDDLVAAVATAWNHPRRASLSTNFRGALDELDWNRAVRTAQHLTVASLGALPAWIDGIDRTAEVIDLKTFGWNAVERAALQRDADVEALNARVWRKKDKNALPAAIASADEQRQVAITNDYRCMFGRCALAWHPLLQVAAQGHSDWMSLTGTFSHFETDPERRSPVDRMRLAGYKSGAGENCSMGDSGPEGAHMGLTSSSGHHRNILNPAHRELASSLQGIYWTQNFGVGRDFERELSAKK
ncbi:MAG: CAP domain-containing protein [Planctomycetota bacterium]|nr:CAP domain-containing protein [Planctomycetota bacterium]